MRIVEVDRPCPRCGVAGWYGERVVRRGSGLGVPSVEWVMEECGHAFWTPEFVRWGEGWVKVDPRTLDAEPCG